MHLYSTESSLNYALDKFHKIEGAAKIDSVSEWLAKSWLPNRLKRNEKDSLLTLAGVDNFLGQNPESSYVHASILIPIIIKQFPFAS